MICDDRDPPWINNEITQLIEKKNNFSKDSFEVTNLYFIAISFLTLQK